MMKAFYVLTHMPDVFASDFVLPDNGESKTVATSLPPVLQTRGHQEAVSPCKPHLPRGRYPTADRGHLRLQGEFQNGSYALQGVFANAERGRRSAVKRHRAVHYPHSSEQAGRAQSAR